MFWKKPLISASRVVKNKDDSYSILNVVSRWTCNTACRWQCIYECSAITKQSKKPSIWEKPVDPRWIDISDNLVIHVKMGLPKIIWYEGQLIKQADEFITILERL
jgi:hypothetical protein